MDRREEIARIVDPEAYDALGGVLSSVRNAAALAKADLIMAVDGEAAAALARLQRNLDLIGLCPKCAGSHHGRHEGACDGPPRAELPPHKMMG